MRRYADSLYARLALVLLLALGASYATMYLLFRSKLQDSRISAISRSVAARVKLIEDLVRDRPNAPLPVVKGLRLAGHPQRDGGRIPTEGRHFVKLLGEHLIKDMGRPVTLIPVMRPEPGLWVKLYAPQASRQWLRIALPVLGFRTSTFLISALLVGFAVVLAGGMTLLWQIQHPLKRLGKALEAVGQASRLERLPLEGAGEIRLLGERYNAMVDRLRRYEEDRATMLAGVAHDLRSPITRLRLLMELDEGARRTEMQQNLDNIERITEQFLVYARGSEDEAEEVRDAALFVDEVLEPYRERQVTATADGEELAIAVRANSLRRAIVNLVDNAIEYGRPPVTVRVLRADGMAAIAVEDAGPGIGAEEMARALRPFSRLDRSRSGKGHCGLGLVIAAKIAEEHRGALNLRTRPGGFIAEIRLPLAASPVA